MRTALLSSNHDENWITMFSASNEYSTIILESLIYLMTIKPNVGDRVMTAIGLWRWIYRHYIVHDPTATSEAFGSILVFHLHQEGGRSTVITLSPTLQFILQNAFQTLS